MLSCDHDQCAYFNPHPRLLPCLPRITVAWNYCEVARGAPGWPPGHWGFSQSDLFEKLTRLQTRRELTLSAQPLPRPGWGLLFHNGSLYRLPKQLLPGPFPMNFPGSLSLAIWRHHQETP